MKEQLIAKQQEMQGIYLRKEDHNRTVTKKRCHQGPGEGGKSKPKEGRKHVIRHYRKTKAGCKGTERDGHLKAN